MCEIKKQTFIAELGRLLTFMYEEDRQETLGFYDSLFDEIGDEEGLSGLLVSPTRQAVLIARAYDAKEQKLQVHSQQRNGEYPTDETPKYIEILHTIRDNALTKLGTKPRIQETVWADAESEAESVPAADENQISLFPDEAKPAEADETVNTEENEQSAPLDARQQKSLESLVSEIAGTVMAIESAAKVEDSAAADSESMEISPAFTDESMVDGEEASVQLPMEEFVAAVAPVTEETVAPATEEIIPSAEEVPAPSNGSEQDAFSAFLGEEEKERKAIVALLIPYIIVTVPIALLLIAAILLLAAVFMGTGIGVGAIGLEAVKTAIAGFPVFANTIVVAGAALVILALALLLLWIFIWLIGGAVVGLIRGIVALGGKLCYKEVAEG